MTIEEIRKNAPFGATHYQTIPILNYLKVDEFWVYTWFSHLERPNWVKFLPVCKFDSTNTKPL